MTRGKHGAAAAKRRAESAEEQLDRLLPQLVDAQRQAKMFRTEAEAAPLLRRQLSELRKEQGVPVKQHEQELSDLEARHEELLTAIEDALIDVFDEFARDGALRHPTHEEWINAELIRALQTLPRGAVLALFKAIGVERELGRFLLETTTPDRAANEATREVLNYQRMAAEGGRTDGKIPATLIRPRTIDDVMHKRDEAEQDLEGPGAG